MTTDDQFTYDVCGRTLHCKRLAEGQLVMMQRLLARWQEEMDGASTQKQRGELIVKMSSISLDLIESQLLNKEDVAFLEEQLLMGKVDLEDLRPILSGGRKVEKQEDDQPVKATKAVRTPRKAAKRTPVKGARKGA